jgi:hypothetical protein
MKKENYLLLILMLIGFNCFAQEVFEYDYDAKGNRISRVLVVPPIHNFNQLEIVNDTNSFVSFSTYPNPINEVLTIEKSYSDSTIYDIKIVDIAGKLVFETRSNRVKTIINTSEFNTGVYLVVIYYNGKRDEFKIIKN